ncbi:MAG: glycerophosphodiester phosphodiesterase [Gemmatimonadota bacterium]
MGVFRRFGFLAGAAAAAAGYRRFAHPPIRRHPRLRVAPLLVGHRGAAGLAPENTIEGCREAVERWGAEVVEVDVHATADGACVLLHDPTVDRTTDGSGAIGELPLARVRELDAGFNFSGPDDGFPFRGKGVRVPTFGELLAALPATVVLVDVKTAAAAAPLADAVRAADASDRVIVAGESASDRATLHDYPGPTGITREDTVRFFAAHHFGVRRFWRPTADVACLPERHRGLRVLTPGVIGGLHERGLAVYVWTVNDAADMRRLLDWGADGIITDRPDVLYGVLADVVGRPPPPGAR